MLKTRRLPAYAMYLILCLWPSIALGRNYSFQHITKDEGLPSNTVYDIYRDSKGFLWIATDKGIVRFNGISFKKFSTSEGMPDNEVLFFREDLNKRLWMGTYNGALCYYQNGKFHTAANTGFLKSRVKSAITTNIVVHRDSSILITYSYQDRFNIIKQDSVYTYTLPRGVMRHELACIAKKNDSIVQVRYGACIYDLNILSGKYFARQFRNRSYMTHCQDQFWLFDYNRFYSTDGRLRYTWPGKIRFTGEYESRQLTYINKVFSDGGTYFVCTNNGVYLNNDDTLILPGQRVSTITKDNAGDYWFATLGNGIYRLGKAFRQHNYRIPSVRDNVTFACSRNGAVFFATGNRKLFKVEGDTVRLLLTFSNKDDEDDRLIGQHIDCCVHQDNILCMNTDGMLYAYSMRTGYVSGYRLPVRHKMRFRAISSNSTGIYLNDKMNIVFLPSGTLADHALQLSWIEEMSFDRIYALTTDTPGHVWYQKSGSVFKIINDKPVLQSAFTNGPYKWLHAFRGYVIGCTFSNKLFLYQGYEKPVLLDSFYNGIYWERAYSVDQKHVLLSTANRYYTLALDQFKSGLFIPQVVENPSIPLDVDYFLSDTGRYLFFKDGSITVMEKSELFSKPPLPAVFFTEAATNDSLYHIGDSTYNELVFPYRHAPSINLGFEVLGFNAKDVQCEYSIIQDGKVILGPRQISGNEVNIILPPYGKVEILIRPRTLGGAFGKMKALCIVILPPWWAKWWGILILTVLCLAAVLLIVYLLILNILKRRGKAHRSKVEMMLAEFRAVNAMMNPHFIFNTVNNIQSFINRNDKDAANRYIRTFSEMVRQNMQNVSNELITLQAEISLVESYLQLEKIRYPEMDYQIDIDDAVDTDAIMIPPLLIQPLVENSMKHGILLLADRSGFIHLKIFETEDQLHIELIDNGVGLENGHRPAQGLSYALSAVRKRIDTISVTHGLRMAFDIMELKEGKTVLGTKAVIKLDL